MYRVLSVRFRTLLRFLILFFFLRNFEIRLSCAFLTMQTRTIAAHSSWYPWLTVLDHPLYHVDHVLYLFDVKIIVGIWRHSKIWFLTVKEKNLFLIRSAHNADRQKITHPCSSVRKTKLDEHSKLELLRSLRRALTQIY